MQKKKLIKLIKKAKDANKSYREGNPFISDDEYDDLTEGIKEADPNNEFINSVEPETKGKREEFKHPTKMLSIEKAYSIDEVIKFIERCSKVYNKEYSIHISSKLDGVASNLYKENKYVTRGDGESGYVIPGHISSKLNYNPSYGIDFIDNDYVTGEIVVSNENFKIHLSKQYAHPRNFVAGLVNSDTLSEIQSLALENKIVEFIRHDAQFNSQTIIIRPNFDLNETKEIIKRIQKEVKESCKYPIDGVVLTVQNKEIAKKLGSTNHHNRWQLALKDKAESAKTVVEDVEFQVGRTGVITPVLKIKMVNLSGAKITSVTAHNVQILIDEGIGEGAEVEIIRSGEVIPTIVDVIKKGKVFIPEACPSCAKNLERDGLFLKCNNKFCAEKLSQSIFHWFRCLDNSDWFGIETIRKLLKNGFYFIDNIYEMTEDEFLECGFGEGQTKNLLDSLIKSMNKEVQDWKLLAAFGIPGVERGLSKKILSNFKINELTKLNKEDIISIEGFGEKITDNFVKWFKDNSKLFNKMIKLFNIDHTKDIKKVQCLYSGKNILFTGSIEGFTRDGIKKFAEDHDIIPVNSVSKNTDLVVIGDSPGKTKIDKAEKLGIKIINFNEFKEGL